MTGKLARGLFNAGLVLFAWGVVGSTTMAAVNAASAAPGEGAVASDPWALAPPVDFAAVKTESIDFGTDGMPTSLQSGTVLMAVDVESSDGGALVHFLADGELALARTFALEKPARLVVDLPGIRGDLVSNQMALGGEHVAGVRVGVHPDRLRVVIDGGSEVQSFDAYEAIPAGNGLYLVIGADPGLQDILQARLSGEGMAPPADEEMFAAEEAPEPVQIAMHTGSTQDPLTNPWDEAVETPDDAAILARVAESYADSKAASDAVSNADSTEFVAGAASEGPPETVEEVVEEVPGSEAAPETEPFVVASIAEPFVPAPAADHAGENASEEKLAEPDPETEGPAAAEAAAVDIWALELTAEPVEAEAGEAEGDADAEAAEEFVAGASATAEEAAMPESAAAVPAADSLEAEAARQAEAEFMARTGKVVEMQISDLGLEGSAEAAPVQIAQATTSATAADARPHRTPDPWAGSRGPEKAAASAPAEIFGLQYDRDDARDRIAILADKEAQYRLFEPDDDTLMIILENAVLSEGMGERITPEFGGPISQVTVFQQPDIEGNEVRVVLRRASGLVPDVYQRGTLILADFPNSAVAASLPVVLIPEAGAETEVAVETAAELEAVVIAAPAEATLEVASELIRGDGSVADGSSDSSYAPGGTVDEGAFEGSPISLDFKDVPILDVLRLIAEVSSLNIIAGDEVKGTITLRLVEVPWDQALDIILVTRGLGYVRVGNVLRIAPAEVLQAEEAERLQERRNKEQLEDLEVKLQPVNYAAVADVKDLVRRLLSPRGTVNTDQRTNTVIIKDIPSVIEEATALIEALDTQTPQVMIEAKIVEASLDFGRDLGSTWALGTNPNSGQIRTGGVTWDGMNNVAISNPIASAATGAANMGFLVLDDNVRIDVQVQAMEEAGEGKVISSPRVVTLDNREAVIEQGVSIPFQTFEGGDAKLEFVDAVLSLKVTPHITPDESIIMSLEVSRNAPDTSLNTGNGAPAIAKNQAKTETLVKNGQTLVIGGIYTIEKSSTESRVPYLHKLPLLGGAFKSKRVTDSRKELLIFVTPRIVVNPALADN